MEQAMLPLAALAPPSDQTWQLTEAWAVMRVTGIVDSRLFPTRAAALGAYKARIGDTARTPDLRYINASLYRYSYRTSGTTSGPRHSVYLVGIAEIACRPFSAELWLCPRCHSLAQQRDPASCLSCGVACVALLSVLRVPEQRSGTLPAVRRSRTA